MKNYDWNALTEAQLMEIVAGIGDLNQQAVEESEKRQLSLAKPPGSLGKLEDLSIQIAGITGKVINAPKKTCIAIMSADNGVVAEGVASAPQSVTMAQTINFTRRLTGVGALAKHFGVDLLVMDMGINGQVPAALLTKEIEGVDLEDGAGLRFANKIVDRKLGLGTRNIAKTYAMTREQALAGIAAGLEAAAAAAQMGYDLMGIGEMGIGNTTTSAAVLTVLTGEPAERTVGKGGGISDESLCWKKSIVDNCKTRNGFGLGRKTYDTLDVLQTVGGFDIAAMTGAFLGAAYFRIPVVIDGYISAVAALAAATMAPKAKNFMIASHASWEQGYGIAIEKLGLTPMLNLDMRLGEGSGCPLAFKIIEGACGAMWGMATFAEAEINDDYLEEIRSDQKSYF